MPTTVEDWRGEPITREAWQYWVFWEAVEQADPGLFARMKAAVAKESTESRAEYEKRRARIARGG